MTKFGRKGAHRIVPRDGTKSDILNLYKMCEKLHLKPSIISLAFRCRVLFPLTCKTICETAQKKLNFYLGLLKVDHQSICSALNPL